MTDRPLRLDSPVDCQYHDRMDVLWSVVRIHSHLLHCSILQLHIQPSAGICPQTVTTLQPDEEEGGIPEGLDA
jgi:hypothetical protein